MIVENVLPEASEKKQKNAMMLKMVANHQPSRCKYEDKSSLASYTHTHNSIFWWVGIEPRTHWFKVRYS